MFEIRNKTNGPVQLIVKSLSKKRESAKQFTCLNIPAKKTIFLEDERIVTTYLERNKQWGLLAYKVVPEHVSHEQE